MEHFVKTLMNAQVNLAWPTQIVSIEKVSMNVLTFTGFPIPLRCFSFYKHEVYKHG